MRYLYRLILAVLLSVVVQGYAVAQQGTCADECKKRYVRKFAVILSKTKPTMADYFVLFREPEGPEGLRLLNAKMRNSPVAEQGEKRTQEITLAGDAFDEVASWDRKDVSHYLLCIKEKYRSRLPHPHKGVSSLVHGESQLTLITLSARKSVWKFTFSANEQHPDSIVAPDGVTLGDLAEDSCLQSSASGSN